MQSKRETWAKGCIVLIVVFLVISLGILLLFIFNKNSKSIDVATYNKPKSHFTRPTTYFPSFDSLTWAKKQVDFYLPFCSQQDTVIRHSGYSLVYHETWEQARWVAWPLSSQRGAAKAERSSSFYSDPLILSQSAHPNDYRNSGYDRGHLAPAADFSHDEVMMKESFYMSNMSPQKPSFNRGIWKKLEEKTRDWADENGQLYLVAGPLVLGEVQKIGANEVYVPTHYFKIIADLDTPELKILAFLFPNQKAEQDMVHFQVSVDSIEKVSGLNFFPLLPDSLEQALEAEIEPIHTW